MATLYTTHIARVYFHVFGTLTTGDDQWVSQMPWDFEILEFGGFIQTLGSGAGTSTDIQLKNQTTNVDYFEVKPTIEVDSATGLVQGGQLISTPTGRKNEALALDIDAISTNPANLDFWVDCRFFVEVG